MRSAYAAWQASVEQYDPVGVVPLIVRRNVFPLFLLWVLMVAFFVLKLVLGSTLMPVLAQLIAIGALRSNCLMGIVE